MTDQPKTFPILDGGRIKSVPWSLAERARAQAERNHGQTLERLAQRGGLDPIELVRALKGRSLSLAYEEDLEPAVAELEHLVNMEIYG